MNALSRSAVWCKLPQDQRGGVAIMFGLSVIVLIGFIGLAIDLGRFFVIKSELQNAMDACALSAASQLKPGANDPNALIKAVAYGKVFITGGVTGGGKVGTDPNIQNRVNFQKVVPDPNTLQISFAATNNGNYQNAATADPNTAKFVKCDYPLTGLPIYFMRVLNPLLNTQTVRATAVATRETPAASCVPVAVCSAPGGNASNNFGYTDGEWISAYNGDPYMRGKFGWIDFSPPNGGANEVKDLLAGSKQCDVSKIGDQVGQNGNLDTLQEAWNSRFGWYRKGGGGYSPSVARPDETGFAYSNDVPGGNWLGSNPPNAYSGSSTVAGQKNFIQARADHEPYQYFSGIPPGILNPGNTNKYDPPLSSAQLSSLGRTDRRMVAAPVVDCSNWNTSPNNTSPILGWACMLMLNPIENGSVASLTAKMEFLGLASSASSPCAGGSEYAIAPVLAQ